MLSIDKIIDTQLASPDRTIYGTALHADTPTYKMKLYKKQKPVIVTMGSSRVMQFRQDSFNDKFINMGGTVAPPSRGLYYAQKMFEDHIPDTLILGVDFWWFVWDNQSFEDLIHNDHYNSQRFNLYKLLYPAEWLYKGKITFPDYVNTIYSATKNKQLIGINANINKKGFDRDGSYFFFDQPSLDKSSVMKVKKKIKNGQGRFLFAEKFNKKHFKDLLELIKFIKSKNINLIVFFPPLPKCVTDEMDKNAKKYCYIKRCKEELKKKNIKYYDFHYAESIDGDDSEFIDAIHGGPVIYKKIIHKLAEDRSNGLYRFLENKKVFNEKFNTYTRSSKALE